MRRNEAREVRTLKLLIWSGDPAQNSAGGILISLQHSKENFNALASGSVASCFPKLGPLNVLPHRQKHRRRHRHLENHPTGVKTLSKFL